MINYPFVKIYHKAFKYFLKQISPFQRYNKAGEVIYEKKLRIEYASPERIYARIYIPNENERIILPAISFSATEITPVKEFNKPFLRYKINRILPDGRLNPFESYIISHPLIWRIKYRVDIWAGLKSDVDLILYNIFSLLGTGKDIVVIIYHKGKPFQYALFELIEQNYLGEIKAEDEKDIVIRHYLTFRCPTAIMPLQNFDYDRFIGELDFELQKK